MKVRRHFPGSFRDFSYGEQLDFNINPAIDELLSLDFVKNAKNLQNFYRYSICNPGYSTGQCMLMAEYEEGKRFYVIAKLEHAIDGIPEWVDPDKNNQ